MESRPDGSPTRSSTGAGSAADHSPAGTEEVTEGVTEEEVILGPGICCSLTRPAGADPGRSILYLHGLGSQQWGEKANYFRSRFAAAGRTFCSIDMRGHGRSLGSNLDLTLTRNLEDAGFAARHLASLGVSEIDLVGSSLGGLTALWLGRQIGRGLGRLDASRVRRTAIIAPALGIREKIVSALGDELLERWRREGAMPYVNEVGTTTVGYTFFEDLARYPDSALCEGYDIPTLVLQGERDESVDPAAVRAFANECPIITLHLWPDGDHRLSDRLDEVWRRLSDFLSAPNTAEAAG